VDVVILDLSMPGQGGFETLRKIMNRFPKQKVLVFTMHENASTANQVLKIGASGYLTKSMNPELIVQAIQDVWRGGTPIEEGVASALTDLQNNSNPHDNLLPREYEVFLLLSAGESVDLICSKLNMSSRTVFNYQTTIRKKMGLYSHIEFNQYALRHQLIQSPP
jgi:DNA-binding NarL/FixJ family response regulator